MEPTRSPRALPARELREAYEAVSLLIEGFTSRICPECRNVCCIDRHGTHEEADILFLEALGGGVPEEPPRESDTEPCRHLGLRGCAIPRWRRPYRCTWYFCPPLLEAMPSPGPQDIPQARGRPGEAGYDKGEVHGRMSFRARLTLYLLKLQIRSTKS